MAASAHEFIESLCVYWIWRYQVSRAIMSTTHAPANLSTPYDDGCHVRFLHSHTAMASRPSKVTQRHGKLNFPHLLLAVTGALQGPRRQASEVTISERCIHCSLACLLQQLEAVAPELPALMCPPPIISSCSLLVALQVCLVAAREVPGQR